MKIKKENKRELKRIKTNTKPIIAIITIIGIFAVLVLNFLTLKNKTISKDIKTISKNEKALEQEGQNYRLVTSADNVQVPVPKGYVASQIEGENYVTPEYQHTTITNKVSTTPTVLTWSSPYGERYPWTQDENGIWISGNQGIAYSESVLESEEFDYIKGTTLTINYTYSSEKRDYLNIYLINLTKNITTRIVEDKYGNTSTSFDYTTSNYTWTMNDWGTGRYKIRVIYNKNPITDEGQDSAYIKPSTYFKEDENGDTLEIEQKTKIHNGGFVIYQLTDAEIERDPNGTSVIINNINKDLAQRTRNQYVWVPVPNVEDILRTKTINSGTIQFGQAYEFSNTSIKKITNTFENNYKEPRLVENTDRTRYYLQRYTNIDKRENYLNKQQEEFDNMIKSINKYKGFYIGRYETGDEINHSNVCCFIKPKIVRYNENINFLSWYDSYIDLKRLSENTEKYVETGMLYDSLWDYTLKWLNETGTRNYEEIAVNSGIWGNYEKNEITPQSEEQRPAKTGSIETITYKGEIYNNYPTETNNIFDIAGNVDEWTKGRANSSSRTIRGGNFRYNNNNSIVASKSDKSGPESGMFGNDLGVRSMLYIKK